MNPAGWHLVGAPWDCSGTGRGEQAAPAALRAAGLSALVHRDLGDAATVIDSAVRDARTGVLGLAASVRAAHALADSLEGAFEAMADSRPLVIGGDCSVLLGIFLALRRHVGRTGLLFVDGHPDYLDGRTSPTGETADMDLALLTGDGADPLVELGGTVPLVSPSDVVLLGHRTAGLDDEAQAELARLPRSLRRLDATTVARDPAAAGRSAIAWLADAERAVWLHVDLDVLDPGSLAAVSYPEPGGLDWGQLAALLAPLARLPHLVGFSVADFRPDLDPDGTSAGRIVDLLARTLP